MAARSHGVELPAWWLEYVNKVVQATGLTQAELATKIRSSSIAEPWDRSTPSRFLAGENTTIEMADALSAYLGIVRPIHVAASRLEAEAFESIARLRESGRR